MPTRLKLCRAALSEAKGFSPAVAKAATAACIAFIGPPGPAWAQSSVQLYGELDTGLPM